MDAINRKADEAGRLETRLARLEDEGSPFLAGLEWLTEQRDAGAFVTLPEYRRSVLGAAADAMAFNEANAVTLEISALQYFPWLIAEAEQAIERRELMPGRYIRVRNMAEQSAPGEDILAVAAAMQIIGATHVETLDTKGIDGSNVHLGGPDTITGYFGGIGQPNDYPLKWADEYLHYLTEYGIRQALNINSGTILVALLLHKLGIRNEFKVSVFMGVDNAWSVLWLLMGARLLAGPDGTTSMVGLNLSNSVELDTLLACAEVRQASASPTPCASSTTSPRPTSPSCASPTTAAPTWCGRGHRAQHHRQARGRRPGRRGGPRAPQRHLRLLRAAGAGRSPTASCRCSRRNYLDKHDAVNHTAAALTQAGIAVRPAALLHAAAGVSASAAA